MSAELIPRRLMTVEEFECCAEMGIFGPEERLELIEGEVIQKVAPQKSPHATATQLATKAVQPYFQTGYDVRIQMPLVFGLRSEPEPDVAVVTGTTRDYAKAHPTDAVLIVEVSDTTLRYDRTRKASLYAKAGIADYWILNLVDGVLEIFRQPAPMPDEPYGFGYRSITRHTEDETVAPLAALQAAIRVADLLP